MSDLIKRIDDYLQGAGEELSTVILTDCKAALEAKGEPVAYRHWCECDMDEDGNPVYDWEYFDKASCSECQPLYTTPPSVDALIAEAIEKHDEKNLLIKSVNMRTQAQPYLDELIAEIERMHHPKSSYFLEHMKPILDKYRSAK